MIWLFFINFATINNGIFDIPFTEKFIILYLGPFDIAELNISDSILSIFSNWQNENSFYVEVESIDRKGIITNHGKYNKNSHLIGVYFEKRDYILKFSNEGQNEINFAIKFEKLYGFSPPNITDKISTKYKFPDIKPSSSENLIFDDTKERKFIFYIALIVTLVAVNILVYVIDCFRG